MYGFLVYCLPGVTQNVLPIYRLLYTVFSILATRFHTKSPTNLQVLIQGFLVYCLPGVTQKVLPIYMLIYTGVQCMVYQVLPKRSYQSTGSYIRDFSVLSARCHTKGPTNLQVLIYGFLVYCLPGVTQKVLQICRFLYKVFIVLAIRCHTKGPTNLQVLIYEFLLYCLPGGTQKVTPIYRLIYTGFQCIVYQVLQKRSYQSTGSYIRVFSVLSNRCHTKGPTNLQVLIYGFQCITYQVSHKKSYQSTGSYTWVFSVLPTRCHTKGPTNLQVLIYGFLVYCLPGVTQKVLPIYRFLYMGFQCIVYQVSHKRSYQSTGSYIWVFTVLSTRCHTKGPSNLQVLIYGFLVYCLPGVTQKVLPIYMFLFMGFQCIVYQVSHKRSYQSTGSYIWVFRVLSTRCYTKVATNLQVLIYGLILYCLPGVTQKVLPIYRLIYRGFYCIVYKVSYKRSYQSTGSYRWVFSVLSTRCHTKGPTNLQVLIYGFLVYCLRSVTKDFLPIYRFLYKGFQCIVYQVSHKTSYKSTGSYILVFTVLSTRCQTKGPTN